MTDRERMITRQRVLAEFGEFALLGDNLDAVLIKACRLATQAFPNARSTIWEFDEVREDLVVRAESGWEPGIVGRLRTPGGERSLAGFAMSVGNPVTWHAGIDDERFDLPPYMKEAGVVAAASVSIVLPGGRPYGLLQIGSLIPRGFDENDTQFLRAYAVMLGPIIDRLFRLSQLREGEERFRMIVAAARDYAIFIANAQNRITDWLPGAAAVFGWTEEEMVGRPAAILFTPEDRERREDEKEIEVAAAKGVAPDVRWHLCKDGSRVFIDGSVTALRDGRGAVQGFIKIGQDVTERRRSLQQLRESEERFRQFGEASPDLIWIRNAETLQFEYVSPAFERVYGRSRADVLAGDALERWAELIYSDDRERALAAIQRVRAGERMMHEFRIVRGSDGETRWIRNTDFPLFNEEGAVERVGGISTDVTEQKAGAVRLEVLVAELQHRSRNLLGVISSVASKTLGRGEAVDAFLTRLKALSRAQGLLSQFGSDVVEVGALVREELAAHTEVSPPKVLISGPKVYLTSRQVQNFALAVHELTTNAVKYGALRNGTGRLEIVWTADWDERGAQWLVLNWTESGVPIDPAAGQRKGYGRELIENALSYALQAKTHYLLGEDGVRCRIEMPLH